MVSDSATKTTKLTATKPATAAVKKPAISKPIPNKPVASKATTANKPAVAVKKPAAAKPSTTIAAKKPASTPAIATKAVTKTVAKPKAVVVKKEVKKDDKKHKAEKIKMERDSFTMPKDEYAQLSQLKSRLNAMGHPVKKSELLRAGIKLLASMSDATLKTTMDRIPVIKTGRPKK
jgi:vancomycin resistance protein YoaR